MYDHSQAAWHRPKFSNPTMGSDNETKPLLGTKSGGLLQVKVSAWRSTT